jgi:hypothetical protein
MPLGHANGTNFHIKLYIIEWREYYYLELHLFPFLKPNISTFCRRLHLTTLLSWTELDLKFQLSGGMVVVFGG